MKNYEKIVGPLTAMLQKNAFVWTYDSLAAFEALKLAMTKTLVLEFLDFENIFVVECDASYYGIRVVL